MTSAGVTSDEFEAWGRDGFFLRRGFVKPETTQAMLKFCVDLARRAKGNPILDGSLLMREANLEGQPLRHEGAFEEQIAKIFRLHRRGVFRDFVTDVSVLRLVAALIGEPIDCFLSQFIFKNPGAWGQPWHQDAHYFPEGSGPHVGLWLAITRTTLRNGPLYVVPGSHLEPVHTHVPDRRENALYGYREIIDYDTSSEVPVLMEAGDLLVFHGHLMHRSTDNVSDGIRAAMVYHCARSEARETDPAKTGVMDWMALPSSAEVA